MDDLEREYLISFYDNTLMMFGDRPESLHWTSTGQIAHYEALLDIAPDIEGSRILDFGCGKGDFCGFLKNRNIRVNYTGFDINEKLIALGREKHPESTFRVFNIEEDDLEEDFDYVFLCGVFNLRLKGIDDTIKYTLKTLFAHCRIGLAFNALSAHNPKKDFELHHVSPENIFAFAINELSPFVAIRHDRIPYDFTMFVYRDRNASR
jgi:SAM-dependent methyltransferase